ncbi:hypothetical protein T4A_2036 [Trichinella pseudospiralis]|uniref:Uncharacterized protein n=1 Tax=Trichinella pseudospiralis TaxID=6337 RepID=A0A0V1DKD8_TRIPS|nr:hypothetical protein T4A_2036 [Trichinella pseudospiralis]
MQRLNYLKNYPLFENDDPFLPCHKASVKIYNSENE